MYNSREINRRMKLENERRSLLKAMFDKTMKSELERWKKLKEEQKSINSHSTTGSKTQRDGTSQGSSKRLSEEEYAAVKRRKKENDRLRKEWPRVIVNEQGKTSSLSIEGDRTPLFIGDIQSMLLYSLLGNGSPVLPRWVDLINVSKIPHVVMVHIEGVGLRDVSQNSHIPSQGSSGGEIVKNCVKETTELQEGNLTMHQSHLSSSGGLPAWLKSSLPGTGNAMHHGLELVAPSTFGMCPIEELLQLKTEKNEARVFEEDLKNYLENEEKYKKKPCESFFRYLTSVSPDPNDELHPNDNYSRLRILLKPRNLAKWDYPLPVPGYRANSNSAFVLTSNNYKEVTSRSPMYGLDCEMCLTSVQKLELTSISIVNEKQELVYHTLVLPYNPIVNFLTKFSGITPEMLLNVTKRLEDVQKDLQGLLPPDAILVGHSLESDLGALKMMHPYVIDSSLSYNLTGMYNKRSSLKDLSRIFLNEKIQSSWQNGHDPTEDAIASLKLIQLKLKNDEAYGNVLLGWSPPSASQYGWEEIHKEGQQQQPKENSKNGTEEQQPQQDGNSLAEEGIGPFNRRDINIFQTMKSISIAIVTTALCFKNYLGALATLDKMPTVEVLSGNKQVSQRARDFVGNTNLTYVHMDMGKKLSQCPDEATWRRQLSKLDKRLQRIHNAAAPKSVLIYVFSGSSLEVRLSKHSNGFVLLGIKDLPFRT